MGGAGDGGGGDDAGSAGVATVGAPARRTGAQAATECSGWRGNERSSSSYRRMVSSAGVSGHGVAVPGVLASPAVVASGGRV